MKTLIKRLPRKYREIACAVYFFGEVALVLGFAAMMWIVWTVM